MANLSEKLGSLTFTPKSQSPASAGFIQAYAGTTAPQGWYLLDRADDTTIVDCETLYPELWDLANTNWRSGSDLVIPVSVYGESALKAYVPTVTGNNTGLSSYTLEYANWKANGRKMLVNCAVSSIVVTDASVTVIRMTLPSGITLPSPSNASVNALYTDDSGIYDAGYVECNGAVDNNEILIRPASGNWSNPSAFKFQLEFEIEGGDFPESIIKLYTDASNIAISLADATATKTGAVRLSSDFAAGSSQYGLVFGKKSVTNQDQSGLANLTVTDVGVETLVLPAGTYLLSFGASFRIQSTGISTGAAAIGTLYVTDDSNTILTDNTSDYHNSITCSRGADGTTDQYQGVFAKVETIILGSETTVKIRAQISDLASSASAREVLNSYMVWERTS